MEGCDERVENNRDIKVYGNYSLPWPPSTICHRLSSPFFLYPMIDFSKFNSLIDIVMYFNTPEKCKQTIVEASWGDSDIICPYYGQHHCKRRKDESYCRSCNHNFLEIVGSIFENTKVSLAKWFMAMYFISVYKKGIFSH